MKKYLGWIAIILIVVIVVAVCIVVFGRDTFEFGTVFNGDGNDKDKQDEPAGNEHNQGGNNNQGGGNQGGSQGGSSGGNSDYDPYKDQGWGSPIYQ